MSGMKPWEVPISYNEAPADPQPGPADDATPVVSMGEPAASAVVERANLPERGPVPAKYKADPAKRDPDLVEAPPRRINYYSDDRDSELVPRDSEEE